MKKGNKGGNMRIFIRYSEMRAQPSLCEIIEKRIAPIVKFSRIVK
jgi:hypothetical protein